jgi:hypothetical protein
LSEEYLVNNKNTIINLADTTGSSNAFLLEMDKLPIELVIDEVLNNGDILLKTLDGQAIFYTFRRWMLW